MIKRIWYEFFKLYVTIGLRFYFRKYIVKGVEKIPKKGALIFTCNHQNAFLDALVLACTNNRYTHYWVRADVFKNKIAKFFLGSFNLMPVYRIRDGWQALAQNDKIFAHCVKLLQKEDAILLFPEGNHSFQRRVRPLSKGFTRLIFERLSQDPTQQIYVVPTGINYVEHMAFGTDVSIYYGDPILCNPFYDPENIPQSATSLKDAVAEGMKPLITHIDDPAHYDEIIAKLEKTNVNYLDPVETNARLQDLDKYASETRTKKKIAWWKISIAFVLFAINFIPLSLWKGFRKIIKDPVMVASMKYIFGIVMFPLTYFLQYLAIDYLMGKDAAVVALAIFIFSMPLYKLINR